MPRPLTSRQREILTAVVESYIATGEPVSSGALAQSAFGNANAARKRGEYLRGALEECGCSGDSGEAGVDMRKQGGLRGRRWTRLARLNFRDVETKGLGGGDAAGGGVRLIEQAGFGEVGHLVSDGRRTHSGKSVLGEGAGADRLAGRDVALDDGGEDFALTGCKGMGHSVSILAGVSMGTPSPCFCAKSSAKRG